MADGSPLSTGSLIDRDRPLRFRFDGGTYAGFAGDTVGSALMRCGVRIFSRSFKYHRPRGVLSLNQSDSNLLVTVNGVASLDAGTVLLEEGMCIEAQNVSGSLARDRRAVFGLLDRFLSAGFYYRHFYRPSGAWPRFWEPFFRRQAGLGRVDMGAVRKAAPSSHAFFEVVVVGGGPAGLIAASKAAGAGARVLLIDRNKRLGGSLNYCPTPVGLPDQAIRERLAEGLSAAGDVTVWTAAVCSGWFADQWLAIQRGGALIRVRAGRTIFALGSHEEMPAFRNNDLPGIMFGATAMRLIELYGIRPGLRAVVAIGDERGYAMVRSLSRAGVDVAAILDMRPGARLTGDDGSIRLVAEARLFAAVPSSGNRGIRGVQFVASGCRRETVACDLLVVAGAQRPADHLYRQAVHTVGPPGTPAADGELPVCEGAMAGIYSLPAMMGFGTGEDQVAPMPSFPSPKAFVDFDEDVTVGDLSLAAAKGYADPELMKRFTTAGMGPSQGRHSAQIIARWLEGQGGVPTDAAPVTTARPPVYPEKLSLLAGTAINHEKHSPLHDRTVAAGARIILAGGWLRPGSYGQAQEEAVDAEIAAIRHRVGLIDVSPLGKLEIRGREAGEFLDRLYAMAYTTLPVGRTRYLLMTSEAGYVVDDGVVYRVHEELFYATATSGGVERVFRAMLRWQATWNLDVTITHVTNAFAALNLAGPLARTVIQKLGGDINYSAVDFPYLAGRQGQLDGVPARVMRIGFVGELGFELHFPAEYAARIWDALMLAGANEGLRPVGLQAMRALRLEKAHIIVGQDTDPLTWPDELGMQWAVSRRKAWFVGKTAIELMRGQPLGRQLVQFVLPLDGLLPEESDLVIEARNPAGFVTSVARSQACGKVIGLALLDGAGRRPGDTITIVCGNRTLEARLVNGPFYDPDGQRQEL